MTAALDSLAPLAGALLAVPPPVRLFCLWYACLMAGAWVTHRWL